MHVFKPVSLLLALALFVPFQAEAFFSKGQSPEQNRSKCNRSKPIKGNVIVERVVDGDTVIVRDKSASYSIRMLGVDTPETYYRGHSQGEWGELASDRLKELLPAGSSIRLELSPEVCDTYGRYLSHIFLGKMHANKQLVQEGLAVSYCVFPSVDHCDTLGKLTENSIQGRIGMFSDPTMELPYDFRRRISGQPQRSYVGSLRTKQVFEPGNQDRIPVGDRVFFFGEEAIEPPYQLVK